MILPSSLRQFAPRAYFLVLFVVVLVALIALLTLLPVQREVTTQVAVGVPACKGVSPNPPPPPAPVPPARPPGFPPKRTPPPPGGGPAVPAPAPAPVPPPDMCTPQLRCPKEWYQLPKCEPAKKKCLFPAGATQELCSNYITCRQGDADCQKSFAIGSAPCGVVGPGEDCPVVEVGTETNCKKCFDWRWSEKSKKWVKGYQCEGTPGTKKYQCEEAGITEGRPGFRVRSTCELANDGVRCTGICQLIAQEPDPVTGDCIDVGVEKSVDCAQPGVVPAPAPAPTPIASTEPLRSLLGSWQRILPPTLL